MNSFPAPDHFPTEARLLAPAANCHFLHCAKRDVKGAFTALEAWNHALSRPLPLVATAFKIRDAISARFGVHPIGGFTGRHVASVQAGERLDFFLVEESCATRLLLTERAKHLDVMTCLTATPTSAGTEIAITSSVVTHNAFGRAYMLFVGPAHRLIVQHLLRRIG
jgi:hypothetical protein